MIIDLNQLFRNQIRARILDAKGRMVAEHSFHNELTYAAADMMINALLKTGSSSITYLYARFGDSGANPGNLNPAGGELINTVRNDFLVSSDNIRGGLWVPTLTVPQQVSSDANHYLGNQANFFFVIPYNIAAPQVTPANNWVPGSSYIYALGLAISKSAVDRTQDIIVSVAEGFTPYPVPPGGQIGISYPLVVTINPIST